MSNKNENTTRFEKEKVKDGTPIKGTLKILIDYEENKENDSLNVSGSLDIQGVTTNEYLTQVLATVITHVYLHAIKLNLNLNELRNLYQMQISKELIDALLPQKHKDEE